MRTRDLDLNAERRKAILEAAATCFIRQGFHATSMKDVCVEAGMSPGTLYHYFGSKADIIAGITEAQVEIARAFLAPLAETQDFIGSLLASVDALSDSLTERDLMLYSEIDAEILRQDALRKSAIAADRETIDEFAAAIARAQEAGAVDSRLDPRETAVALSALLEGAFTRASLHGHKSLRTILPVLKQFIVRMLVDPRRAA